MSSEHKVLADWFKMVRGELYYYNETLLFGRLSQALVWKVTDQTVVQAYEQAGRLADGERATPEEKRSEQYRAAFAVINDRSGRRADEPWAENAAYENRF